MGLNKRQYTDGTTIITAANLNEIQDCIIALEGNYVPKTRTVNSKALSSNIVLSASDVNAVPKSRTVNNKALSSNISLTASDVGAAPTDHSNTATTYGKGTSTKYGHVKLTDSLTDTTTAATGGLALSPKAGKDLKDAINNYENVGKVYHVGTGQTYTSFTGLLYALRNDTSPKTIYIHEGVYDIFNEYTALGLLSGNPPANPTYDYFDYNVLIPENTHVIGLGQVILKWMPSSSQISVGWSQTISAVNCAGPMTLENVSIFCKNGRYCIHDDPLGDPTYNGARKIFKNVRCLKYTNDTGLGFRPTIGFGMSKEMYYEFDNCQFDTQYADGFNFYMHNRGTAGGETINAYGSPKLVVNNCVMTGSSIGVKFGNVNNSSSQRIYCFFENCHIDGDILVSDEGNSSTGTYDNTFDIKLLQCYFNSWTVRGTSPRYTPTEYDTVTRNIFAVEGNLISNVTTAGNIFNQTSPKDHRITANTKVADVILDRDNFLTSYEMEVTTADGSVTVTGTTRTISAGETIGMIILLYND